MIESFLQKSITEKYKSLSPVEQYFMFYYDNSTDRTVGSDQSEAIKLFDKFQATAYLMKMFPEKIESPGSFDKSVLWWTIYHAFKNKAFVCFIVEDEEHASFKDFVIRETSRMVEKKKMWIDNGSNSFTLNLNNQAGSESKIFFPILGQTTVATDQVSSLISRQPRKVEKEFRAIWEKMNTSIASKDGRILLYDYPGSWMDKPYAYTQKSETKSSFKILE